MPDDDPLDGNPLAPFTELGAVYDSLFGKRMEHGAKAKRGFWQWLKDAFEAPGLKARSSVPTSVSIVNFGEEKYWHELLQTPGDNSSDPKAALTKLKAIYDSVNENRTDSGIEAKSGSWKWLNDKCEQGSKTRSLEDRSPTYSDSACTAEE